jgi:NAD(P)-dependent dehydrogenase (short-subunit alcohol dehydrogenase family)
MQSLKDRRIIVTGGHKGLGLGLVEALVEHGARVVVVGRDRERLAEVERRLGVTVVHGDVSEPGLAGSLLREFRPTVVALNAGAKAECRPVHEQTWDEFSAVWNNDVKAGLQWIQEAIRLPLAPGSRVLVSSSGAAVNGSPLSGGYAGAKRMLWLMANYANGVSAELGLGIRFQTLVPRQMVGDTERGRNAAEAYARRQGISVEAFLAGFGAPLSPRQYGDHVVQILSEPRYEGIDAFSIKGDYGVRPLEMPVP